MFSIPTQILPIRQVPCLFLVKVFKFSQHKETQDKLTKGDGILLNRILIFATLTLLKEAYRKIKEIHQWNISETNRKALLDVPRICCIYVNTILDLIEM